jgi:hypothetical protein
MDLTELVPILVALTALYGAILSTVIFIQKLHEKKTNIVIEYYDYEPDRAELYIGLTVVNRGEKTITLSYAAIEEEDPDHNHSCAEPFMQVDGREIKRHTYLKIPFSIQQIPESWLKNKMQLVGIVRDQLGNEYRSEIIEREPF